MPTDPYLYRHIFAIPRFDYERVHICAEDWPEAIEFLQKFVEANQDYLAPWQEWGTHPASMLVSRVFEPRAKGFMMIHRVPTVGLPV